MSVGRKQFDGKDEELVVKKLEEVWGIGGTDEEACFYAEISRQSLHEYFKKHPELIVRRDELKERPILKARTTVVEKLGESYQNAMDYLKRKRRDEFGDESKVNLDVILKVDV